MTKKLARNRNAVLQLLARGVLGKNTQEANELVQAEMGIADYCHDCQGEICDSVCGPIQALEEGGESPKMRMKRSPVQDWVDMQETKHHVLVTTNTSTHGRPYIYPAEIRHPFNLTVPASVVVNSNKFDPRMRLSMDPPRHMHAMERLSQTANEEEEDAFDYDLSLLAYDCSQPQQVRTIQSRTE